MVLNSAGNCGSFFADVVDELREYRCLVLLLYGLSIALQSCKFLRPSSSIRARDGGNEVAILLPVELKDNLFRRLLSALLGYYVVDVFHRELAIVLEVGNASRMLVCLFFAHLLVFLASVGQLLHRFYDNRAVFR